MAPGDLLTAPGQVEDVVLFDVAGPWESGYWLTRRTAVDGFTPLWESNDTPSHRTISPGPSTPSLTYPTLAGVAVETPELLLALEAQMSRDAVARFVCWWDLERDEKVGAWLKPRGLTPSQVDGKQFFAHKVVDLRWLLTDTRVFSVVEDDTTVNGSNPTVPNPGTEVAPWRLVVEGPCTHPRVRNMDTNQAWRFDDLTLTADQTLTVDTRALTAVVSEDGEDDVSVWHQVTDDGGSIAMLWGITPGGMPVGFASDAGATSATLYVRAT